MIVKDNDDSDALTITLDFARFMCFVCRTSKYARNLHTSLSKLTFKSSCRTGCELLNLIVVRSLISYL